MRATRRGFIGAVGLSLAGCGLGNVAPAPTELDLGGPPPAPPAEASWRFDAIVLPAFNQAKLLGTEDVVWRLGADGRLNRYATYRWRVAPATLVRQRLFERLSRHGAVLTESINAEMPQLRVTLMQFEQVYAPDGSSNQGIITLQAVLVRNGKVLGQFLGTDSEMATANTAAAGAQALRQATDRLLDRLMQWLSKEL